MKQNTGKSLKQPNKKHIFLKKPQSVDRPKTTVGCHRGIRGNWRPPGSSSCNETCRLWEHGDLECDEIFLDFMGFSQRKTMANSMKLFSQSIVIHNILLKWFKFSPKSMHRSGGCDCQVVVFIPASACMRDIAGLNLQEGLDAGNHLADPNHPSKKQSWSRL